jgi:uncharacterized damage-inducible protein DinB
MKRLSFCVALGLLLMTAIASAMSGEPRGFRGDFLGQLSYLEKKIVDLENAVPEAKYSWSPSKDVRTISQVYSHVAYENYMFAKIAGIVPPADIPLASMEDGMKWEKASTDKKTIHNQLTKSFDFVKAGVRNLSDAKLDNVVDFFGMKMSVRGVLMAMLGHIHEHLGQSIAYARSVGVVPPWTAQENAMASQTMK